MHLKSKDKHLILAKIYPKPYQYDGKRPVNGF
jgi:hypothetical protein